MKSLLVIRHWSFVIGHSAFVIRHSLFGIHFTSDPTLNPSPKREGSTPPSIFFRDYDHQTQILGNYDGL